MEPPVVDAWSRAKALNYKDRDRLKGLVQLLVATGQNMVVEIN